MNIDTRNGYVLVIDDADADIVRPYRWRADRFRDGFNVFCTHRNRTINLRRLLTGADDADRVVHRNGNWLDFRRSNLLVGDSSKVQAGRRLSSANKSGFKGVFWHVRRKRWVAEIRVDGRKRYLGGFDSPEEAAEAYDREAVQAFGPFAKTNEQLGLLAA